MKTLVLSRALLLISALVLTSFSIIIDEKLSEFRGNILSFQRKSLINIDGAFFSFYELLYTKLNLSVIQSQIELIEQFNSSCLNFPIYTLEPMAARRFINICDDFQSVANKILKMCAEILEKYYPTIETLDTETVYELLAKDYFASSVKSYDLIFYFYEQNPKCVEPLLNRFLEIYRKPIDVIMKSCMKMAKFVKKGVERDLKFIRTSTIKLYSVASKMKSCSNDSVIDTFGCVSEFVGYDCFKKKSGCGIFYKSIYIVLDHMKRINSYYDYYDDTFTIIFESFRTTEQLLVEWMNSASFCVNE